LLAADKGKEHPEGNTEIKEEGEGNENAGGDMDLEAIEV
jgi:hypothetical protein